MVLAVWVSICSQPCAAWINNHHDLHLSSLSATLDKNMPNDYLDTQVVNRIECLFVAFHLLVHNQAYRETAEQEVQTQCWRTYWRGNPNAITAVYRISPKNVQIPNSVLQAFHECFSWISLPIYTPWLETTDSFLRASLFIRRVWDTELIKCVKNLLPVKKGLDWHARRTNRGHAEALLDNTPVVEQIWFEMGFTTITQRPEKQMIHNIWIYKMIGCG